MKIPCFILAIFLFTESTGLVAQHQHPPREIVDQDYMLALGTVNHFLCAWQMRRQEEGLALLSPRLKKKYSEEDVRMYISGISNPHHAAFEVGRGKRLAEGPFAFPASFYQHYAAGKETFKRPKALQAVVIQIGAEEWTVDELPGLVELPRR